MTAPVTSLPRPPFTAGPRKPPPNVRVTAWPIGTEELESYGFGHLLRDTDAVSARGAIATIVEVRFGYPGNKPVGAEVSTYKGRNYVHVEHFKGSPYLVRICVPNNLDSPSNFRDSLKDWISSWAPDVAGACLVQIDQAHQSIFEDGAPSYELEFEIPTLAGFYELLVGLHLLVGDKVPITERMRGWLDWWMAMPPDQFFREDCLANIATIASNLLAMARRSEVAKRAQQVKVAGAPDQEAAAS